MIRDELVKQGQKIIEKLDTLDPTSDEYRKLLERLKLITADIREYDRQEHEFGWSEQLNNAKLAEINKPFWKRDGFIQTLIGAGCTLGTTAFMLNYEKFGNITSKALGFIPKPKLK